MDKYNQISTGFTTEDTEYTKEAQRSSFLGAFSVVNALDSIKKPASVIRSGPKISFSVLTEFVKYFHQMFSNHLSISSFNVMTLNEVKQFTVFEECDGR